MKISVIGGGYVGLVSSACLADLGHTISIIEIDKERVDLINAGLCPICEKGLDGLLAKHIGKNLIAVSDYSCVPESDISLICVGTPPKDDGDADLSMVLSACKTIGNSLQQARRYHIVAVKSTVPPGTTERLVIPTILRLSDKDLNQLGFVMNPEFLREGLAVHDFMNPDRIVVGSHDDKAGTIFESLYCDIKSPIVRTSITSAEMIKYASNAFLATKISFSNEIGNICKRIGISVYEVMQGVGMDHRISPHFLNAGVGFGGSCFPKDVSALIHLAEQLGEDPILMKSVMKINEIQPSRMISLLEHRIGNLQDKKVAVLGLAFKNDTDDVRDSRSITVIKELKMKGAKVTAYDPKANFSMKKIIPDVIYCTKAAEALKGADACLIMTEWPEFELLDSEFNLMKSKIIIEGRKVLPYGKAEGICW